MILSFSLVLPLYNKKVSSVNMHTQKHQSKFKVQTMKIQVLFLFLKVHLSPQRFLKAHTQINDCVLCEEIHQILNAT